MLNAREAALFSLQKVMAQQSLSTLLPFYKKQTRPADQALFQSLVYGCLREYQSFYALLTAMMPRPPARESTAAIILILGVQQLLRLHLGDHGVLNETVKLMQRHSPKHKNLCNAILRRLQRERPQWLDFVAQRQTLNLPPWLRFLPEAQQKAIAAVNVLPPPFSLRFAPNADAEALLKALPPARKNPLARHAWTLGEALSVLEQADFGRGLFSVQDASAQRAAELLQPQNGERILDACAAPGGKTAHMLQLAPEALLTALDSDGERLQRVRENLERIGARADLKQADAADTAAWWDGKRFDAILLDAPCSGSGVLRRHPDIAFLRSRQDLQQHPRQQKRLLMALWPLLKPGGRLLYCTCSILPPENQRLMEAFLQAQRDARLQRLNLSACDNGEFGSLHLPDGDGDGFFYALLHKV